MDGPGVIATGSSAWRSSSRVPSVAWPWSERGAGVLLTPHTAGYGPYLDDRRLEILLDNGRRFAAGLPLRNVVDKASWF
jgi:hypothetical protein